MRQALITGSDITNILSIQRIQSLQVVPLEPSSIWHPFLIKCDLLSIRFSSQLDHFFQFFLQSFFIRTDLSKDLVSIQAKHKLRLRSDSIMPCNFRCGIAVDLEYFKMSIFSSQFSDLLISDLTLRIPVRSEVDKRMCEFILEKKSIKFFKIGVTSKIGIKVSLNHFKHMY